MTSVIPRNYEKKPSQTPGWKTVWFNFSQATTLHGVSHVTEPTPFFARRILWLLLVLTGFILFGYQALDRVMYYYQHPVTVNLKINHNKTMSFPALTICNQNTFRMTTAYRQGRYQSLDELFSLEDPITYNATQQGVGELTLDEIYSAAHQKEDMIVRCSWGRRSCRADDFKTIATDYGMCFSFNSELAQPYTVSQTGVDEGLQLLLNVEQYEYMAGPHGAAGLKILLHDQAEVPYVRDLGSAIPIGSSAFVGVRIVQINNLPDPHGECARDQKLRYYDSTYSASACVRECKADFILERCGCLDIYLPGNATICNLHTYLTCLLPTSEIFDTQHKATCVCPVPCSTTTYDTDISYATTSSRNAEIVLRDSRSVDLGNKYLLAGEVRQRVDPLIVQTDKALIRTLAKRYSNFDMALGYATQTCADIKKQIIVVFSALELRLWFHRHVALEKIKYNIHHDFIRGYDVMNERTLFHVTTGYNQFIETFSWYLNYTLGQDISEGMRDSWYSMLKKELILRQSLVERAMDNITEVFDGYTKAIQILTYRSSYKRRYDKSFVAPKMLYHSKRLDGYFKDVMLGLSMCRESLTNLDLVLQDVHFNKSYNIDTYAEAAAKYGSGSRKYNYNKFRISDRIIYKAEEIWDDHISVFDKINNTMVQYANEMTRTCLSVNTLIEGSKMASEDILSVAVTMAMEYLSNQSASKRDLADIVISPKLSEKINGITTLASIIRLHGRELTDTWGRFSETVVELWKNMLNEDQTYPFYQMLHDDLEVMFNDSSQYEYFVTAFDYFLDLSKEVTRNKTKEELISYLNADFVKLDVEHVVNMTQVELRNASIGWNIAAQIGEHDIYLAEATNQLQSSLKQYMSDIQLSHKFFRNNFLELNIFMQQLSYEEILQQEAYDIGSLFSDIGGSLGLFIGASVLTLAEVLDVIIHTLAQKLVIRRF